MKKLILKQVRDKMGESNVDSLIINGSSNIRYLTGFRGDFGYAVITRSHAVFLTNPLYIEDARSSVSDLFEIVEVEQNVFKNFGSFESSFWGKTTGFEEEKTTFAAHSRLKKALSGHRLIPTVNFIEEFRESKHDQEIDTVKRAQAITELVFSEILSLVREGVEERDIAIEIDYRFRKAGGERAAFETIVASGPNTSKPHAVPTRRKLQSGDFVLFDMGTFVDGYASDMTRTVVLGKASDEQRKVYGAVLDAQTAALEAVASGAECAHIDSVARSVIDSAGFGDRFVHSLGHGVGLDVHENPYLSKRSKVETHGRASLLRERSIVTVEPGIYIPGWGGVRIEDMVVVKQHGCENLTGAPKDLVELSM